MEMIQVRKREGENEEGRVQHFIELIRKGVLLASFVLWMEGDSSEDYKRKAWRKGVAFRCVSFALRRTYLGVGVWLCEFMCS